MPAKSKSQQRLFGMLHAYNKGELKGSKSLMKRLSSMSKGISDEDATHFAQTPHKGLPEKKAFDLRSAALSKIAQEKPALTDAQVRMNELAKLLDDRFGTANTNLTAGILANVDRESDSSFDHTKWEGNKQQTFDVNAKQTGGYGLFQLTGPNLTNYKKWLTKNNLTDSSTNQVDFVIGQYGKHRTGWKDHTQDAAPYTRKQQADWWYRYVETPRAVLKRWYDAVRIAADKRRHANFMNNEIELGTNGVWQAKQPGS